MGSTMPKSPVSNAWGARGAVAVAAAQLDTTSALAAHLIATSAALATVLAALAAALAAAVANMSRLKVSRCVFRWR